MEQEKNQSLAEHAIETLQEKLGENPVETLQEKLGEHPIETIQEKIGDSAEQAIGNLIENTPLEAPELQVVPGQGPAQGEQEPEPYQWYRVPVADGKTADGSGYHI